MTTWRKALLVLALAPACTEDPLVSSPTASSPATGGSPTSFDPPVTGSTGSTGAPTTTDPTTTGSTSNGEATTEAPDGTACGDGVVAGTEECDLGPDNANTGACTLECKHAACGDGLVHTGVEECDFGLGNDTSYNGCDPITCNLGPHCGDGVLDLEHEVCDRGELNGTGITPDEQAPCTYTCGFFGRLLFITGETWTGDLGGVSGGDLKCRAAALAAGLPNATAYRAWLSDDFQAPVTRFEAWDSAVPVILVGGLVVAADLTELVEIGPRTGISRTEVGSPIFDEFVWTNTSAFGEIFSITNHCTGWTFASAQHSARIGWNALAVEDGPAWESWQGERWWTSYTGQTCDKPAHLYCLDDGVILDEEK